MSLPPALLQRLAQRGLVQKSKQNDTASINNEEVIAEDYDELDADSNQQNSSTEEYPSQYDYESENRKFPRTENFGFLERMRARMGEAGSAAGYKGCPNKYNIWHKCTLYCVNRWAEGNPEPSREYMVRFKRLLRKYPLPKGGWKEVYDPGCGCYYFYSETENLVSWLPPTHPKSHVTKSAAFFRKQMEDTAGVSEEDEESDQESSETQHQREILDIINSTLKNRTSTSPSNLATHFPSLQEVSTKKRPRREFD